MDNQSSNCVGGDLGDFGKLGTTDGSALTITSGTATWYTPDPVVETFFDSPAKRSSIRLEKLQSGKVRLTLRDVDGVYYEDGLLTLIDELAELIQAFYEDAAEIEEVES